MINAYPSIMAVNKYQTNKDYYRVGAVSGVSGGKSSTIRRTLDLPFEELAYKQFAQAAAKDVASRVTSAENAKQSAQALINTRAAASANSHSNDASTPKAPPNINQKIQDFIHTYNELQDQFAGSPDFVSHTLLQGLEDAAKPSTLQELGITKQDDGKLVVQADVLNGQMKGQFGIISSNLNQLTNFASSLVNTIEQMQQQPAAALFQLSSSPLKPYGQYQSQLQAYLPVPLRGILLDARM